MNTRIEGLFGSGKTKPMKFDIRKHPPVVSVCLITYNHASYIYECLDSILMQQTDFPYEVCIGEDESTDGTREICLEYADKYPDRIRLMLRSQSDAGREKYSSQGVYNYIETSRDCRAKYIAMCDGDDVWTDPLKLQKQYDIMEAEPSVSLVHSDYDLFEEHSGHLTKQHNNAHKIVIQETADIPLFKSQVILREYPIAASTTFARTKDVLAIFEDNLELFQTLPMGDIPTWCELIDYGTFHYMEESLAVYRIRPESDSNSKSATKRFWFKNGAANLGMMYGEKYALPMERFYKVKIKNCNRYALLSGEREEIQELYMNSPYHFPFVEFLIYHAARFKLSRNPAKWMFEFRYNIRNGQTAH